MDGRFTVPGVSADTPLSEAAPAILRARADALLDLEVTSAGGMGPEAVHDLRVASRRLREALRLLAPAYGGRGLRRWHRRVRELTRAFGPVRDADVLVEALEQVRTGLDAGGQRAAVFLAGYALGRRERDLIQLSGSLPEIGLITGRDRFERDIDHAAGTVAGDPLSSLAHDAVSGRSEVVSATRAALTDAQDPAGHHELRIAFKQLRYAVEVFAPCYGDDFGTLYDTLKGFQDSLGEMHDAQVFAGIVEERRRDGSAAAAGVRRRDMDSVLAALLPAREAARERFVALSAAHPAGDFTKMLLAPLGSGA